MTVPNGGGEARLHGEKRGAERWASVWSPLPAAAAGIKTLTDLTPVFRVPHRGVRDHIEHHPEVQGRSKAKQAAAVAPRTRRRPLLRHTRTTWSRFSRMNVKSLFWSCSSEEITRHATAPFGRFGTSTQGRNATTAVRWARLNGSLLVSRIHARGAA